MTTPRDLFTFAEEYTALDTQIRELDPIEDWQEISSLIAGQALLHSLARMQLNDNDFDCYKAYRSLKLSVI